MRKKKKLSSSSDPKEIDLLGKHKLLKDKWKEKNFRVKPKVQLNPNLPVLNIPELLHTNDSIKDESISAEKRIKTYLD